MKIKESFILGLNCMFDLDATVAREAMQEILDKLIDPQTHRVTVRDVSLNACFRMTGEQFKASLGRFETNHSGMI